MTDKPADAVERVEALIVDADEVGFSEDHNLSWTERSPVSLSDLRTILALARSNVGWQPIETAPKDQWVLAWDEGGGHALLRHNEVYAMAGEDTDGWMGATHWQPLPSPPDKE